MELMEFDHVAISSTDIDASVQWYKQFLDDVEILYQDDTWAFLKAGTVKIAFITPGQHPPHVAVRVETDTQEASLAEAFPKRKWKDHRDGSKSFYTKDNCGNIVEFIKYA
jgi:catechol 2,3-dioxygenase-like lactoylglutathione lyase family enzyme|tara:strand:- start:427 stop:756 length:330 start_codon:yes stop_codon:yes gene_type:complete